MDRADYERLRWRCIRRALLELDITLTRFLDGGEFDKLNDEQQQAFVELADMEDHDLWDLINGRAEIDDPRLASVVTLLRKS
jgi:antitoxin CptB